MESCDPVGTSMEIKDKLDLDQNGTPVDATKYRSMIGALMYLTSSRPDIDSGFELTGFSDADYAGCKDTFKSTSGGAQFLGEKLLMDYGFHFNKIPNYCDSKLAIAISCNPVQHSRTKHIDVRYHFIKEHVEKGTMELYFVKTDYQLVDIFNKALPVDRFNYLVRRLGIARLWSRYLSVLPSPYAVTYAFAMFFCIAKVSHFEIIYRAHRFEPTVGLFRCFYLNSKNKGRMSFSKRQGTDAVCYTKPLDSLKGWNDHFFWIDAFAYPALFRWHIGKSVSRDVIPKYSEFSPEHYATLVAYPAPFHKYPKSFLRLVGMSRNYTLNENTYLKFLRNDDEGLVRGNVMRMSPSFWRPSSGVLFRSYRLLLIIPRVSWKLAWKSFLTRGSGEQTEQDDSTSGGQGIGTQLVDVVAETVVKDVAPAQLKRQKKRKTKVGDAGEPSHPPKKLRDDYGAPGGPTVGGKS
uniref:Retrovirus-related Pol polyprotein from transposon TNT 1-94 n=1 Tax=Tanacetum cinerariifolium TaxID=118510 RepID=A0A6L2NDD3_TANCI|nr:hypothetical protein [Tanacetum cinerariifolium]